MTPDRSLTNKTHIEKRTKKCKTRDNIIQKLIRNEDSMEYYHSALLDSQIYTSMRAVIQLQFCLVLSISLHQMYVTEQHFIENLITNLLRPRLPTRFQTKINATNLEGIRIQFDWRMKNWMESLVLPTNFVAFTYNMTVDLFRATNLLCNISAQHISHGLDEKWDKIHK